LIQKLLKKQKHNLFELPGEIADNVKPMLLLIKLFAEGGVQNLHFFFLLQAPLWDGIGCVAGT